MPYHKSLQTKSILSFLIVIAPLIFLTFYINFSGMKATRLQTAQSTQNLLTLYTEQISRNLTEAEDYLINIVATNSDLLTLSIIPFENVDYKLAKASLQETIRNDMAFMGIVRYMFMYNRTNGDFLLIDKETRDSTLGEEHKSLAKRWRLNIHERNWKLHRMNGELMLVKINQFDPDILIGMSLPVRNMMVPLHLLDLGVSGSAYIMDDTGVPVTPSTLTSPQEGELRELLVGLQRGSFELAGDHGDEGMLAVVEPIEKAGLRLGIVMAEANFLKPLHELQQALYIIPFAAIIVLLLYILMMRRLLFKPILSLVRGIRDMLKGNFNVKVEEKGSGELIFLTYNFNKMVSQIENLKIDLYEEQLRTNQAELKQLQMQINPHFYMNTLNIINSYAALREYEPIEELAMLLADYCRFTMRANLDPISLCSELNHIRNYLHIQKMRFEAKLTFSIDADEETLNFPILPLTVQPFVENAIIYGFKGGSHALDIRVTSAIQTDGEKKLIELIVRDNGPGFKEEILRSIREGRLETDSSDHLGIWNVYQRTKVKYGGKGTITCGNGEHGGAVVILRLPFLAE